MASLTHILVAPLLLILLVNPSSASVSVLITQVMRKQICSQNRDPNLCNRLLADDPRTTPSGLYGLASAVVNLSLTKVTDTAELLEKMQGGLFRQQYIDCSNYYDEAVYSLNAYANELSHNFFRTLDLRARNAAYFIDVCERKFVGTSNPLAERNHIALVLCDTAASVAILLKNMPSSV